MSPVTHSPFLQALGYTIISSLWQFALLWLIYVLVNTILTLNSHQKYTAGLLLQLGGFIWFVVTFSLYFREYSQFEEVFFPLQKVQSFYTAHNNAATLRQKMIAWIMQSEKLLPYLSVVYLLLLIFFGAKWIKAYNFTNAIRTKGLHKIDVNWRLFVKQISAQLGIKREVNIYVSEIIKTPLTIGFFKPLILIPLASLNHLNTDQMEAVILHELAHIKRFDYLFNLFLALIETALFFNPFMILISRQIKRERENCCDDWVLQYNYNPASYAGALLQIATLQTAAYLLVLKAADNQKVLLNRIKRMMEKKEITFFNYRYQLIALLVMITVLGSLALLSARRKVNDKDLYSPKAISQQITPKLVEPFFLHTPLNSLSEKIILKKSQKRNEHFNKVFFKTDINNKNILADSQSLNAQLLPLPNEPASPNNDDAFAEFRDNDFKISNLKLDKVLAPQMALKAREIKSAEEYFKKMTAKLLDQNQTFFNRKEVFLQMKDIFEQLKNAKIQLESAEKSIKIQEGNKDISSANQLENLLQGINDNLEQLKSQPKELQSETEKAETKLLQLIPKESEHTIELKIPSINFSRSFTLPAHSFSFEFSSKQKVKDFSANYRKEPANVKKIKSAPAEDADNFTNEIITSAPQESHTKVRRTNKSYYIIRI